MYEYERCLQELLIFDVDIRKTENIEISAWVQVKWHVINNEGTEGVVLQL
jgi:hypothetical protein